MAEPPTVNHSADMSSTNRPQLHGWYSIHQLCSMITGALIFLSGGMSMAHGLLWTEFRVTGYMNHFHYCWFIAVIVGTILSLPLIKIIPKKFIMGISTILILGGGIIFTGSPNTNNALVAGRYLNGLAVGLAIVPYLMHSGETTRVGSRGACLGLEQYALTLGMAYQMIVASQWDVTSTFPVNRLHGILDILFGLFAAVALKHFVESPVDYLRMGSESAALDSLTRLQRPAADGSEANAALEEHKAYLSDQNFTKLQLIFSSIVPLVKMIFFRSMMLAFTFSMPLTLALQYSMGITFSTWPPMLAACLRICGGFFSLIVVDKIGRKLPALLCALTIGALMIAITCISNKSANLISHQQMSVVTTLCLIIQLFAGLYAPLTSAYMGEAFPLKAKQYCMALCVIVEQGIQIIVICNTSSIGNDGTFMAEGIMILVASVCFAAFMPETRKTTLREAQQSFWRFLNFKMH